MGHSILILGESGTGKSTSIRHLPSNETFIINVINKPLPFKGSSALYKKINENGSEGNYYASDNFHTIKRIIKLVNDKRLDIQYLIIDDFGYTLMNEFMKKSLQKGYDKFTELGKDFYELLESIKDLRDDLFCFVMMHVENDMHGKTKPQTIGKMIDQYIKIEGKFSYIFHTFTNEGKYKFITNHDGIHMAKTPLEMFNTLHIENDLKLIADTIKDYEMTDIQL